MDDISLNSTRLLNSSVVEERLQGVRLLSGRTPVPMETFFRAFGDQDWRVRKEAVRIFLSIPDIHGFIPNVIDLLHDSDNAGLRNSSIEILISLGPLALDDLTSAIACPDPEVRKFVIDILGEIGSPGCEEGVLNALNDEDTNVRYAAVETLGKLSVTKAVGPLLELMESADTGLRFTVLEALSLIGKDVPIDRLSCFLDDRVLRKALLECFGKIGGAEVLPYLVEGLMDPMRKIRESSLCSLGRLVLALPRNVEDVLRNAPESLSERLINLLEAPSVDTQRAAIRLVAIVGGLKAAKALLPLLEDDTLRDDIVSAFRSQDDRFFDQLLETRPDSKAMADICLIYLAGELGNAAGLQLALDSLSSPDPQLRYTAVATLGKIAHQKAILPLVERLKDEVPDICDAAAGALEMFGSESFEAIAKAVCPLLTLPESELRMRAVRILGSFEGESVEAALLMALKDPEADVRCESIKALRGSHAVECVDGLKMALADEVADVRRLAAESLGACPGDQTLQALSLAVDDQDPWVRAAAVRSLAHFTSPQAEQLLLQLAEDPVGLVVIAVLETLVSRDSAAARPHIEKALGHQDEEVVKASIDLLVRGGSCDYLKTFGSALLNHPHRDVRIHALKLITRLCGKDFCPLLEQRLSVEKDVLVHQALEETLNQLQRSGS